MLIKSIDDAVRKAIGEAGDVFRGQDIEQIVKEACDKGAKRIDLKMPITITTADEPWIYISSTVTVDRHFELFVIVNLSDVTADYLKAKVYQGVFATNRPRAAISFYEKCIIIKAEDYARYTGSAAVRDFASRLLATDVLASPEFEKLQRSVRDSMTTGVAVMSAIPMVTDDRPPSAETFTRASVFEAPGYSRSFSLNAPPGIVELVLNQRTDDAKSRFNESIDRQLIWEVDGDMDEMEAIKAVSKSFGGLLSKPSDIITRLYYDKAVVIAEGKSYALAHVREAIHHAEVHNLVAENPLWGSW